MSLDIQLEKKTSISEGRVFISAFDRQIPSIRQHAFFDLQKISENTKEVSFLHAHAKNQQEPQTIP